MRKYTLLLIISIYAFSCKAQKTSQLSKNEEIIILHTNDIHGNIDNMPRLAYMVDSIRKIHKTVYLFNAGDIFTGNPYVDMYKEKGLPIIDLMNDAAYDLTALGNHEFDYSQETLVLRMKQAKFPFICSNIFNDGGILPKPKEYFQIKTKNGLVIKIFSLLDNSANGLPQSHPTNLKGLRFENGLEIANKYNKLKKGTNVFIALTHLGIEGDEKLAAQMPMLDLIIGAHSHTTLDTGRVINGVLIAQAGARARFLGELTLILNNGKIIEKKSKLLPVLKDGSVDLKLKAKVDKYNNNPYFDEILGNASENLTNVEELGCFITDAYRDYSKSDVAFQNSGGIRISEMDKGDITRGLIYKIDPFGNKLLVLKMDLQEMKSFIYNSFENNEIDIRVSGIKYNIVTENGKINDILITDENGMPISENKIFTVAMNDYIYHTYKFDHKNAGEIMNITTAEVLMEYIKKSPINYSGCKRTSINSQ
jgi:2',3'-cyclic-nucleotide 2'-phosphodiesterase (5'-nucleotidase family)